MLSQYLGSKAILIFGQYVCCSMSIEENMQLMKTLDDAWNTQDWDTFNKRHTEDVAVYWPGKPEPTRGRPSHKNEAIEF